MKPLDQLLFVCADETLQQKLPEVLTTENYCIAENIDEATALLNEGFEPNLIIVDLVLPKLTGAETLAQLQNQCLPKVIPGIIMTSNDRLVLYSLARAPELLGVMSKKGDSELLLERIYKLWDDYQIAKVNDENTMSLVDQKI
ncbi:response regulator [Ignatzschineria sp. LJL83]